MKNQKGFSPVIIIVVLVLIGVAGYFGYQYLQIYSAKSFDECVKLKSSTFDANETGNFCTTKYGKKIYPTVIQY